MPQIAGTMRHFGDTRRLTLPKGSFVAEKLGINVLPVAPLGPAGRIWYRQHESWAAVDNSTPATANEVATRSSCSSRAAAVRTSSPVWNTEDPVGAIAPTDVFT